MLRDLRIMNFRGLREFAMSGLGRVNLLVGTNNCGKTTVLEAIHILSVPGSPLPLWQAQLRRGELLDPTVVSRIDVARLVHGHQLAAGSTFSIEGSGEAVFQKLFASFDSRRPTQDTEDGEENEDDAAVEQGSIEPLRLELVWSEAALGGTLRVSSRTTLPINRRGGGTLRTAVGRYPPADNEVVLITTDGLTRDNTVEMFDRVVLTPQETTVLQALRTIEPDIERIASIGRVRPSSRDARGGLAMMVAGQRIPIGSMGDGIWRLLGIALALVNARGSVLLVDEIDTGLHYSVLVDMWRLVFETARSLNVQVFATTHSRDCYEALAAVAEPGRNEISLQRIERGKARAVAFTEREIQQAAERGLEVR